MVHLLLGRSFGLLWRQLHHVAYRNPTDPRLQPDGIVPGSVLDRVPEALVVEFRPVYGDGAFRTRNYDLQRAGEAGATSCCPPLLTAQYPFQARLSHVVAVLGIGGLAFVQRGFPFGRGQLAPVALTQRGEPFVPALGRQIHPGIGQRAVFGHTLAAPEHLGDHALRGFVGVSCGALEEAERLCLAACFVVLQAEQAVMQIRMPGEESGIQ